MDAVDVALVDFDVAPLKLIGYREYPLEDNIRQQLRGEILSPDHLGRLDTSLGRNFANATEAMMSEMGIDREAITAIGSHGQTAAHHPDGAEPFSLQLGDPNIIAQQTGITTVADFRRRDIAAGGQGAPLAPGFHAFMFRHQKLNRTIVNIGGIANLTVLPADHSQPVTGFDTGPGNTLLDAWTREHMGRAFDNDGEWAAGGTSNSELLDALLQDSFVHQQGPKSTGTGHYNIAWLRNILNSVGATIAAQDVQATLSSFTTETIVSAIDNNAASCQEVFVCGGGAHNSNSMTALAKSLGSRALDTTDKLGLPADAVEACAFAWLAERRLAERPANLPSVTGAERPVVLGGVYSK